MKKDGKLLILDILGIFFLALGITAIINSLLGENPTQILFMCYLGLIIIGIGILTRRSFLIMSQVYILTIPLLVWDIDFFFQLFTSMSLWGLTDYFFVNNEFTIGKIVTLQHLFTIPLAIYAASLIGIKRTDAWKLSFVQIILVFIAVTILSPPDLNINCISYPCLGIDIGLPYRISWFLAIFSMTFLTSVVLHYFPSLKVKNNPRKNNKK